MNWAASHSICSHTLHCVLWISSVVCIASMVMDHDDDYDDDDDEVDDGVVG